MISWRQILLKRKEICFSFLFRYFTFWGEWMCLFLSKCMHMTQCFTCSSRWVEFREQFLGYLFLLPYGFSEERKQCKLWQQIRVETHVCMYVHTHIHIPFRVVIFQFFYSPFLGQLWISVFININISSEGWEMHQSML